MFEFSYDYFLFRLKKVLSAYYFLKDSDPAVAADFLKAAQLFLLDMGHLNANFSKQELERLHYPRTLFGREDGHTYIRSKDTLSMEILKIAYREKFETNATPIWIESELFWNELARYRHFCWLDPDDEDFSSHIQRLLESVEEPVFVASKNLENLNRVITQIEQFKKNNSELIREIIFCFKDEFFGLKACVVIEEDEKIIDLTGNLGYKVDPIFANKALLELSDAHIYLNKICLKSNNYRL